MDSPVTPEAFDDLDDQALRSLHEELTADFDTKYDSDEQAPIGELTELAERIERVRSEIDTRAGAAEAEAAERDALAQRIRTAPAEEPEVEEAAAEGEAADAEIEVEEAAEEAAEEKELVTASAHKPSAAAVRSRSTRPTPPEDTSSDLVITASADVPGYSNGQRIDRLGIAKGLHARARGLGDSKGRGTRFSVASIESNIPSHLVVRDNSDADAIMREAVREQMAGKDAAALVASGGWCAPSETLYDMFSVESRDGLIDLPSIGVSRGGIQYPTYMGIDVTAGALWTWSETNDITPGSDGPATKPCLQIPCPTWTECRLTAEGLCVTAGNLMDRANPEGTARFLDLVMTAHAHRMSNAHLAAIIASATAVTVATAPSDAAGDILGAIDLQVADYRSEHLMGSSQIIDGYFPQWFVEAIRSTLAMRAGVDTTNVSNAEVVAHFTTRNVRPQFLAGYEALYNAAPATAWPTTSKFTLAPAGGYVVADGGSLDLGVVRDSTLNETNDFTAAWSEEFHCVMQLGPAAREVSVSTEVNGVTGGPALMPVAP